MSYINIEKNTMLIQGRETLSVKHGKFY